MKLLKSSYIFTAVLVMSMLLMASAFFKVNKALKLSEEEVVQLQIGKDRLIKELVLSDLRSKYGNANNLVVKLREYTYLNTKVGRGGFDYGGDHVSHFLNFRKSNAKQLCDGMAATYQWLLSLFGIPSRTVQLATKDYVDGKRGGDTHVTVEVFDLINNQLYVSDPTFNITLSCKGHNTKAGIKELRKCALYGNGIDFNHDGISYIKDRVVEGYYLPYEKLLYGVKAPAMSVKINGSEVRIEEIDLPEKNWLRKAIEKHSSKVKVN